MTYQHFFKQKWVADLSSIVWRLDGRKTLVIVSESRSANTEMDTDRNIKFFGQSMIARSPLDGLAISTNRFTSAASSTGGGSTGAGA